MFTLKLLLGMIWLLLYSTPDNPPDNLSDPSDNPSNGRIHRDEDFQFVLSGLTRCLADCPLMYFLLVGWVG